MSSVQSDGRIILGGSTNAGNYDFALARLNADGTLDVTFASGGKVVTDFGSNREINTIRVTTENKILVAGYSSSSTDDFVLARHTADGVIDSGFGTNGRVVTPVGTNNDKAYGLLIQPDGKIVVAGSSTDSVSSYSALARYDVDGSLDTTFDTDGKLISGFNGDNFYANDVVVQGNGKIVVGGHSYNGTDDDFALERFNVDGSVDTTFGVDGHITTSLGGTDQAFALALQPNGKILVAGFTGTLGGNYDFAVAFNPLTRHCLPSTWAPLPSRSTATANQRQCPPSR